MLPNFDRSLDKLIALWISCQKYQLLYKKPKKFRHIAHVSIGICAVILANFAIWRKSDYLHDLYFILKIYIWLFFYTFVISASLGFKLLKGLSLWRLWWELHYRCNLLWQLWKLVSLQMPKPLEKKMSLKFEAGKTPFVTTSAQNAQKLSCQTFLASKFSWRSSRASNFLDAPAGFKIFLTLKQASTCSWRFCSAALETKNKNFHVI